MKLTECLSLALPRGRSTPRALALALALAPLVPAGALAQKQTDSCIACHGDPDFLVTAKKLYDYFQDWENSVHRQEGVTCVDCHGGNPGIHSKKGAHGEKVHGGQVLGSAVSFENIPATCGECHEEIYDGYRESDHSDHLSQKKQEKQGPNCVTCHGSINATLLNVTTVERACVQCHNEKTDNHPEIPVQAGDMLNRFLSIHRYYRYLGIRGDPVEIRAFFEAIDRRIHELSVLWHTFDLPKIEKETTFILDLLKAKRAEVRSRQTPSP